MIFLGDYGDRGEYSAEVDYVVLKLKLMFPDRVILMRGNHEGPADLLAYPHDLPIQFRMRFGDFGTEAYRITRSLFDHLLNVVYVEDRYLLVHGGIPVQASSLKDFTYAHKKHPKETFFEEILWSDPIEDKGAYPSPRGAGKLFGWDITERVLKALNVKILIRGHEPCNEGFKINHYGKVLTLFSRKGSPYFNVHAAYLQVDLSKQFNAAGQLAPFIQQF
jgi:protein phosphatase